MRTPETDASPGAKAGMPPRSAAGVLGSASNAFRLLLSNLWEWEAEWRGAEIQGRVLFLGRPIITMVPGSSLVFGGDNQIASSARCTNLGNVRPCVLRTLAGNARLELGKGVGISGAAVCSASSIVIGAGTFIGPGALIFDNDFHRPVGEFGFDDEAAATARPISIGRGCFIGANSIIMKGVKIGDRCAVSAGAVVTGNMPPKTVAIGNPARIMPWTAAEATSVSH